MNNQQNNKNDKNDKDNKKKNAKILAIFLIVSILGTFFFNSILTKWRNGTEKTISYNKFVTMLDKDQVKSVKVTDSQLKVTPKNEGNPFYKTTYTVQRISGDYELVNRLIKSKIAFEQEPEDPMDTFLSILISLPNCTGITLLLQTTYTTFCFFPRSSFLIHPVKITHKIILKINIQILCFMDLYPFYHFMQIDLR